MRQFTIKLIIFTLPLFLLIVITDYEAGFIQNSYAKKRLIVEQNIENAQIVFLGNSHIYYGVKAGLFKIPALNLAYVSQDLYYDTRILHKYLPRAGNLKLVVISMSYSSLGIQLEKGIEDWRTSFYFQFWQIPRDSGSLRLADYSSIALFGIQPSRDNLFQRKKPVAEEIDDTGSNMDLRYTHTDLLLNAGETIKRHEANMSQDNVIKNTRYLEELITELRKRNISAVVITTPCFHTYFDGIDSEKYYAMQSEVTSFCEKNNLEYYNYLKDARFTADDFQDSDHLSTQGSEKFTLILKEEIIDKYIK